MSRNAIIPMEYKDNAGLPILRAETDALFEVAGINRDIFEHSMPDKVLEKNGLIWDFLTSYVNQLEWDKRIANGENLFFVTEEAMEAEGFKLVGTH